MKKITNDTIKSYNEYFQNDQYEDIFWLFFDKVHVEKDYYELTTYTEGGVEENIILPNDENVLESFDEFVYNFDIDNEIELHRQGKQYCDNFSITDSVVDFTDFKRWLDKVNGIIGGNVTECTQMSNELEQEIRECSHKIQRKTMLELKDMTDLSESEIWDTAFRKGYLAALEHDKLC